MRFELVQGDLEPDLDFEVLDGGEPDDISDVAAMELLVELPDGTRESWPLIAIDPPTGKVRHVWEAGQTDQVGQVRAQAVLTRGNGEPQTYPSDGTYIRWRVHPRLT